MHGHARIVPRMWRVPRTHRVISQFASTLAPLHLHAISACHLLSTTGQNVVRIGTGRRTDTSCAGDALVAVRLPKTSITPAMGWCARYPLWSWVGRAAAPSSACRRWRPMRAPAEPLRQAMPDSTPRPCAFARHSIYALTFSYLNCLRGDGTFRFWHNFLGHSGICHGRKEERAPPSLHLRLPPPSIPLPSATHAATPTRPPMASATVAQA